MELSKRGAYALMGSVAVLAAFVLLKRTARLPERRAPAGWPTADASGTRLARGVRSQTSQRPGLSGLRLLPDGADAFAARLLLVRAAERRLDLQYYIWHGDRTGTLLLEALHEAAERGVRVRLLLDDNGISGLDTILSALDRHPNIEIRLFNPFPIRFPKALGFVVDFRRLNRRMHNKSLTADAAATIVGGRNIGDEYFGAGDGNLFADLDVLGVGPVVADIARDFERYWNNEIVYPAQQILRSVSSYQLRRLATRASVVKRDPSARRYVRRLRNLPLIQQLVQGTLDLEWARVRVISDDPAKGLGRAAEENLLLARLQRTVGPVRRELGLVSGYFVPGGEGTHQLAALAASGVAVTILTNSYAASDVGLVHAGYAPHRTHLLAAGIRLFEMRAADVGEPHHGADLRLGVGSRLRGSGAGTIASLRFGASTLHAKTFTIDRERLFIGSFNLDPRSARLNTELGFVIDSPRLAREVADALEQDVPEHAYALHLSATGALRWEERQGSIFRTLTREPSMTALDRTIVAVASLLPIAWLL